MADKRTIKRYTNRKLYDKLESRYVTLEEIARLVRGGEDVKVIDNETEEDLTAVTFAQIILDEEKRKKNLISVPFLRKIIRSGEARVQDFSDRASRGIGAIGDLTEKAGEKVREVVSGKGPDGVNAGIRVLVHERDAGGDACIPKTRFCLKTLFWMNLSRRSSAAGIVG